VRSRLALAALAACLALTPASAGAKEKTFSLGVAAAEVSSNSAILWARANQKGEARLQVDTDPGFKHPVRVDNLPARDTTDFTVQKLVTGLSPATTYYYRWLMGSDSSDTGRFTTAPPATADRTIRFAWSGDADAQPAEGQSASFYDGLPDSTGSGAEAFGIYRQMAAEGNDFNVNLGDTIYSDSEVPGKGALAATLEAKWAKYRQNLSETALQQLRGGAAIYNHWDDHEFVNDFSKPEHGTDIYRTGVEAFRDYMPVNYSDADGIYNQQRWGKNLEVFRLDERSFRSAKASANHACDNPDTGQPDLAPTAPQTTRDLFAILVPSLARPVSQQCKDTINDPNRTFLGSAQFDRFTQAIKASDAKFKVVINELPIQQTYAFPYDRWEGYEAERKRLLHFLEDNNVKNVVFLATDVHANWVNVVRYQTIEPGGPQNSRYKEFVTGPVSTMTGDREIDRTTGRPGAGALVNTAFFKPPPPGGLGMECVNGNVYSYGEVQVTGSAVTITAKDVHGNIVRDQAANTPCTLTIPAQ
jgi:alkaline phosphatase D